MRKLQALFAGMVDALFKVLFGPPLTPGFTCDNTALLYRMNAGFPGDVTRKHYASIVPALINTTAPPVAYGGPVMIATDGISVRALAAGDGSATPLVVYGILVRPYPIQQRSGGDAATLGAATPPTSGACDVLRAGFIMGKIPAAVAVKKGDQVFAWAAVASGAHIQGQLEGAASSTSTVTIINARFAGPADALGNVEIEISPNFT